MVQVLIEKKWLEEWPVKAMVCDREFFLSLLQERWPLFLDKIAKDAVTRQSLPATRLRQSLRDCFVAWADVPSARSSQ